MKDKSIAINVDQAWMQKMGILRYDDYAGPPAWQYIDGRWVDVRKMKKGENKS